MSKLNWRRIFTASLLGLFAPFYIPPHMDSYVPLIAVVFMMFRQGALEATPAFYLIFGLYWFAGAAVAYFILWFRNYVKVRRERK